MSSLTALEAGQLGALLIVLAAMLRRLNRAALTLYGHLRLSSPLDPSHSLHRALYQLP